MSKQISITPGQSIKALTPSDSVDFDPRPRGIVVGAGTVVIVNEDDTTTSLTDGELAAGVIQPISPKRINLTGTTATIKGVY